MSEPRRVNLSDRQRLILNANGMRTYQVEASGDGTITIKPFAADDAALRLTYNARLDGQGPVVQEFTGHVVVRIEY